MNTTQITTGQLAAKAMLVHLKVSQWEARKFDRKATKEFNESAGADQEAGRYNKRLIAQAAVSQYSRISKEARNYHYEQTLPWEDQGSRLLPAERWGTYSAKMAELQTRFETAVEEFIGNYSTLIDDARERLNGLFKQQDYPEALHVRAKFAFQVKVRPVPVAGDLRVGLDDADLGKIRSEIEATAQAAISEAMGDLWARLQRVVETARDTLRQPDKIFRDSLIKNVQEVVELIPHLNIAGDQDLETLRRETEKVLCEKAPQEHRDDPDLRKETAKRADALLKKMGGFMGGAK